MFSRLYLEINQANPNNLVKDKKKRKKGEVTERHLPFAGVLIIMLSLRLPSPMLVEAVM